MVFSSGAIENANKTVVQRRTKQLGMRWSINGGQAKEESNLWDEDVKKRILALC